MVDIHNRYVTKQWTIDGNRIYYDGLARIEIGAYACIMALTTFKARILAAKLKNATTTMRIPARNVRVDKGHQPNVLTFSNHEIFLAWEIDRSELSSQARFKGPKNYCAITYHATTSSRLGGWSTLYFGFLTAHRRLTKITMNE